VQIIFSANEKLDAREQSVSRKLDNSRIYKHVEDRRNCSPAFPTNKRQEGANVHELAKHFMRIRHQFMGHMKEAGVSKPQLLKVII